MVILSSDTHRLLRKLVTAKYQSQKSVLHQPTNNEIIRAGLILLSKKEQ